MLPITPVSAAIIAGCNGNSISNNAITDTQLTTTINSSSYHHPHYHNHHRSPNHHSDKVKRYLDYCRQLQQSIGTGLSSGSSLESISSKCIDNRLSSLSTNNQSSPAVTNHSTNNDCHQMNDDDDNETFLLDTWLENKLQASFKQLNCILRNHHAGYIGDESDCEIFFIHHRPQQFCDNHIDSQTDLLLSNQTPIDNGGDQVNKSNDNDCLKICIEQLEKIICNNHHPLKQNANLSCMILTRPNDELRPNNLLYVYPPAEDLANHCDQSSSSKPPPPPISKKNGYPNWDNPNSRLTRLSGMFVTLFDVMIKLEQRRHQSTSTPTSHGLIDVLSMSSLQLSGIDDYNQFDDIMSQYRISFVIENDDEDAPIIMAIAMPIDGFMANDARIMAKLLYDSLRIAFGSIRTAFSNHFHNNHHQPVCLMTPPHSNASFGYLNRILLTLNTMLGLSSLNDHVVDNNHNGFIINSLRLSGTFPIASSINTTFALQHLLMDDMAMLNLCKYLNDYDSLDWIDESIRFYRDGHDIEQALSEHFARCLGSVDDPPKHGKSSSTQPCSTSSSLLMDNNHIFDLLEIELTFFTVIGSCLFYRACLVKSHLPNDCLSAIHRYLYTRAIHALASHGDYHLVNFIRFHHAISTDESCNDGKTDLFLLILGHGHLIHCTVVQVYRFDRSGHMRFNDKYGSEKSKSLEQNESLQLPSSFAFYVFIKESFRLLNFYLNRLAIGEQLEDSFAFTKHYGRSHLVNLFDQKFATQTNDNGWLNKLNPFNRSSKQDDKTQPFTKLDDTFSDDMMAVRSCRSGSHSNYSIAESLSNASLYSQSTIHSTLTNLSSSFHPIHSLSAFHAKQSFPPAAHLPDSMVCYLNIEQDAETFYAPILNVSQSGNTEQWLANLTSELLTRINQMRENLQSMCLVEMKRRQRLRSSSRHVGDTDNINSCRSITAIKSSKTIILKYIANGQPISKDNQMQHSPQIALEMAILLIGDCHIKYLFHIDQDQIIDEFYACFLLKHQSNKQQASLNESFNKLLFGHDHRQHSYRIGQPDSILANFDQFIESVRLENRYQR
ncbi:uncharacterized protein LOC113797085 [Dermatophagoides pteronyssinus]|uniref:uncharacterized protein LOC113797085 n=1 Tax=Dermatophagoides pteronyssinus TaxID=6956 RepID=UPI003F66FAF2